ncbi:MAG: hypothetical protein AB9856_20740 [Cellulosilyticaceae bacterium]
MGIPVMIMGPSGSGKSTSLRNFEEGEIGILNVASKPLPFRKKLPKVDNANYQKIYKVLGKPTLKSYAIDDSQYLMAFGMFDRAKETGYGKFTDIALDFKNLLTYIITQTPPDVIVYFLHHTDITDDGHIKAKTSGKMLDNQLTVEGLFSIVLLAMTDGATHKFITQSDGYTTAKSPLEMFDREIDNDLKFVDKTIREYWELGGAK